MQVVGGMKRENAQQTTKENSANLIVLQRNGAVLCCQVLHSYTCVIHYVAVTTIFILIIIDYLV